MTSKATRNERIQCGLCKAYIDGAKYRAHVLKCGTSDEEDEAQSVLKTCPMCGKQVEDLAEHCLKCTGGNNPTNYTYENRPSSPARQQPATYVSNRPSTKQCSICSERIALNDYEDHVDNCGERSSPKPKIGKNTKECVICSKRIAANDYEDHVENCGTRSSPKPKIGKNTKECVICSERIAANDYEDHVENCGTRSSPKPKIGKNTKECVIRSERIAANDYADHVNTCADRSSSRSTVPKNTKECIICRKEIAEDDYVRHVDACLAGSSSTVNKKPSSRSAQKSCFTCSSPVDSSKNSSHTVSCKANHIYCLKCLQRSMNKYIESNTAPVCDPTLCDYEFSRYDIECLPLAADVIQRLLPIVKSTRRPQCPFCLFYVDFKTMNDFEKHAFSCTSENLIPCEYCQCLYNMHRLDDHSRQCRSAPPSQQQQALIDFILPRTKYPVTVQQIRVFLEHRKKNRLSFDPHSIINSLAEFDGAFPLEIRTRDCDVCAESYLYDDIFVFGCEENHKLCYGCFEDSCKTKMNSKEVLTCPMCAYQLQDGELKQLRVPTDQKKQFLEYQTQKTFIDYTGTQGVIKCPKQGCKWVAEVQNPNDRFQVQCPLCGYEFCSLCNQQYHFRTTCQQIPEITQRWVFWCNTERGNYWQARAQQDASFRAQLEDYERQRAANTQRNEELRQRYDELLADENFKAQSCRLCPKCQRVVQHLSGCDLMVCGRNYHGGDNQSGCGQGFKWSQALPYVPLANTGPQQVRTDMPAPEQQKTVVHEGIQCDACHNDVQGIRFDCVHCSSLIFCEKCEQRSTLEHSNQVRDQQKQQHVFQLITAGNNG